MIQNMNMHPGVLRKSPRAIVSYSSTHSTALGNITKTVRVCTKTGQHFAVYRAIAAFCSARPGKNELSWLGTNQHEHQTMVHAYVCASQIETTCMQGSVSLFQPCWLHFFLKKPSFAGRASQLWLAAGCDFPT